MTGTERQAVVAPPAAAQQLRPRPLRFSVFRASSVRLTPGPHAAMAADATISPGRVNAMRGRRHGDDACDTACAVEMSLA